MTLTWISDVTAQADWLGHRLLPGGGVRGGYAAQARILHPVYRERPVGTAWPPPGDERAWLRFGETSPEIDTELVTWRDAADSLGAPFEPESGWARMSGADDADDVRDADGWRYQDPDEGRLDPEVLASTIAALTAHTTTPDGGFAAVWDGWDGIVGGKTASSGVPTRYSDDGAPQHAAVLRRGIRDMINAPFRKAGWRSGALSDEISRGPRLTVAGRAHVLFAAAPTEWADAGWTSRVPWRERGAPWVQSPNLVWPADRSWLLVTDPDSETTIVAGSDEAIAALFEADGVEAVAAR